MLADRRPQWRRPLPAHVLSPARSACSDTGSWLQTDRLTGRSSIKSPFPVAKTAFYVMQASKHAIGRKVNENAKHGISLEKFACNHKNSHA